MKLDTYLRTLQGAVQENKLGRYVILALCIANLVLVTAVLSKNETVVMVPPTLSESAVLSSKTASASAKEAWASFVIMQLGNVTPRTADYVGSEVGRFIAPAAYSKFMLDLAEQTRRIKEDNITIQFSPTHVFYVSDANMVVVSGEQTIRGMRDAEKRSVRTFEVGVSVSGYQVRVDSIVAYDGPWKPMREEEERLRLKQERAAQRAGSVATTN